MDARFIQELGERDGVPNLSEGDFPSPAFPVNGLIHTNGLIFVKLACRDASKPATAPAIRVWFLVVTGTATTFLAESTIRKLTDASEDVPSSVKVAIQDPSCFVDCHKSASHFADVNVLGAKAMRQLGLGLDMNFAQNTVRLFRE
ncbi:hypothetical protein AAVH_12018 [Aphelenchoides avenae]|nr:hypothetical protein AAVH_12018 [Aphelenchus avenae]